MRQAHLSIDTDALQHNLEVARQTAPHSKIMSVVKANAYGHGVVQVAKALQRSDGFAVACVSEAITLRQHGVTQPLLVLQGAINATEYRAAGMLKMTLVMHNAQQLALYSGHTENHPDLWLKIDTGMHRLGFAPNQVGEVMQKIQPDCSGFMTHFSDADDPQKGETSEQLALFNSLCDAWSLQRSAANSAALLTRPDTHFDWVRPGIMLYGATPLLEGNGADLGLQPVMTLHAPVISVKTVLAGEAIGYGSDYVASADIKVAVISCGYGDGYPRLAPTGTKVMLNEQHCELLGRVSMDMICIDVTRLEQCTVGDEAILWGPELPVENLAQSVGSLSYALLTGVGVHV